MIQILQSAQILWALNQQSAEARNDFLAVVLSRPADATQLRSLITPKPNYSGRTPTHATHATQVHVSCHTVHAQTTTSAGQTAFTLFILKFWTAKNNKKTPGTCSSKKEQHQHAAFWLTICAFQWRVQSPTGFLGCPQMATVHIASCTSCE